MQIRENISLKPYHSFGTTVFAKYFATFSTLEELAELLQWKIKNKVDKSLVVGGGSNVLFLKNYDGIVLKNEMGGIAVVASDDEAVYVKAGGGVNWHQLVLFCVDAGYGGMENLSLIPGSSGASPIQNIGAYGVELKDVFHQLEAYHNDTRSVQIFSLADCAFGYRESVFKHKYKSQFIITSVTFRLLKKPKLVTTYGAIEAELQRMRVTEPNIKAISRAVINIRSSKLPDPAQTGNAGSFFKNPSIAQSQFAVLQKDYPMMPFYPLNETAVKIPAGWLIEQCGWKGYRRGDAGCYEKQALVLVNYGEATGAEIFDLSEDILQSVKAQFNIILEREVNMI